MDGSPYRTPASSAPAPSGTERDRGDGNLPVLVAVWIASALRVAGATHAAFAAGTAFGTEASLALAGVVIIPVLLVLRRV
jgi:hypothetical protein